MTDSSLIPIVRSGAALTAAEVYRIWVIRDLVFAFEQHCEEPEPDGLDLDAEMRHLWLEDSEGITSYLRMYPGATGELHLGRVATRKDQRGRGLSSVLLRHAHEMAGAEPIVISAQAHLEGWYARFGYERTGEDYAEAGIQHTPMRRVAG